MFLRSYFGAGRLHGRSGGGCPRGSAGLDSVSLPAAGTELSEKHDAAINTPLANWTEMRLPCPHPAAPGRWDFIRDFIPRPSVRCRRPGSARSPARCLLRPEEKETKCSRCDYPLISRIPSGAATPHVLGDLIPPFN